MNRREKKFDEKKITENVLVFVTVNGLETAKLVYFLGKQLILKLI